MVHIVTHVLFSFKSLQLGIIEFNTKLNSVKPTILYMTAMANLIETRQESSMIHSASPQSRPAVIVA